MLLNDFQSIEKINTIETIFGEENSFDMLWIFSNNEL